MGRPVLRRFLGALLCLAALPAGHGSSSASLGAVTPLQKVVELLQGLIKTAGEEKHQEQLQYAAYEQFCIATQMDKERAISEAAAQIDLLRAAVQKFNTEADRLALEIENHAAELATFDSEVKAATSVRDSEREEYLRLQKDYQESLDALSKAISVLKAQQYDRAGKGPTVALLAEVQVRGLAARVPRAGPAIEAFLERGSQEPDLTFVPEVPTTAYEPKAGEIVEMLEGLHDKFKGELEDLDKDEVSRKSAFEQLTQDKLAATQAATAAKASKTESKAKNLQLAAEASGDLQDVSASYDADSSYLADLKATCKQKADEFESRQALRKEEIGALQKAVEILSSDEVAGAAKKHLPAALVASASRGASSLLQLRRALQGGPADQLRAAAFLRDESNRLGSHVLSTIAVQVQGDPLAKVKQLIEELIQRLLTEAANEAEHKGWCDHALGTNEHTRKAKTEEADTLRAEIEGLSANVAQMKKDLADLTAQVAEIDSAIANATQLREQERAENNATVVDAQKAQVAVLNATKVLKDFYEKAAKASFNQQGSGRQEPPPIFDAPYQGQQAASGGVLGILEVIHSDFARVESDANAAEAAAQAEYDKFMEDSRISKAQKEVDIKHKQKSESDSQASLEDKSSELENVEEQLTAAEAEFEKLKPACMASGQTYEERVQHRKDEIEALKEALRILSGEAAVLVQEQP